MGQCAEPHYDECSTEHGEIIPYPGGVTNMDTTLYPRHILMNTILKLQIATIFRSAITVSDA